MIKLNYVGGILKWGGYGITSHRVTTCLENLQMTWNLTAVRKCKEIDQVVEMSGGKYCQEKLSLLLM